MICQNCIHSEVCKHKTEAVYECEHFKDGTIKNQYDRIRNMSVEEMARFLAERVMNQEQVHLLEKDTTATHIEYLKSCLFKGYLRYLESEVIE